MSPAGFRFLEFSTSNYRILVSKTDVRHLLNSSFRLIFIPVNNRVIFAELIFAELARCQK